MRPANTFSNIQLSNSREYQDPSRKDGPGHQRHHREDHQTPALRLQAGSTVGADRQEPL